MTPREIEDAVRACAATITVEGSTSVKWVNVEVEPQGIADIVAREIRAALETYEYSEERDGEVGK